MQLAALTLLGFAIGIAVYLQPESTPGEHESNESSKGQGEIQLTVGLWEYEEQLQELRRALASALKIDVSTREAGREAKKKPIERRSARDLTLDEFINDYALTSTPIIITDALQIIFRSRNPWTLSYLERVCGAQPVVPLRRNPRANTWAGLVDYDQEMTLSHYIHHYGKGHYYKNPNDLLYLHDWSLPLNCPSILGVSEAPAFVVPQYFSADYFKILSNETLQFVNDWPSLFIGPKGSQSGLHVDSFHTHFWMILLQGRKRWHIYKPEDALFLYPDNAKNSFPTDSFVPAFDKFPLASVPDYYEAVLEEGEVIFVPAGSPHQVINEDDTVAVSMNYVDSTNFPKFVKTASKWARAGDQGTFLLMQELLQKHSNNVI